MAFPKIRLECVNLVSMVDRHREEVDEMKALFGYHYPEGTVIEVLSAQVSFGLCFVLSQKMEGPHCCQP